LKGLVAFVVLVGTHNSIIKKSVPKIGEIFQNSTQAIKECNYWQSFICR